MTPPTLRMIRWGFRVLERSAPRAAGALAERLFFTPPRHHLRSQLRSFLATGEASRLEVSGRKVAFWTWGSGPAVLFVHGWGSRGARWRSYVEPLVAAGRRVVLFDAPGHGESEGRMSSMPEFARTVAALAERLGGVDAIVAHSLGGAAATLAMDGGMAVRRAAFIAPASDPGSFAEQFARMFRLTPTTIEALRTRSERRLHFRWQDLHVPTMARARRLPLLVLHDRDDDTVPWAQGAAIAEAWPGAELVTTSGLGHHAIVSAPEVRARIASFVIG